MTGEKRHLLRRWIARLWPPYEALLADAALLARHGADDAARWEAISAELRAAFPAEPDMQELEATARLIHESEAKRREIIENKAAVFLAGVGVAVSVAAAVPALFSASWDLPAWLAAPVALLHLLAVVHLLASAMHATRARSVSALALPSAGDFLAALNRNAAAARERLILSAARARWNELALTRKSNCLAVAERLFVRGLVLLGVASVLVAGGKLGGVAAQGGVAIPVVPSVAPTATVAPAPTPPPATTAVATVTPPGTPQP